MAPLPVPGIDEVLVRVHAAGITAARAADGRSVRTAEARDVAGIIERFGGGDGEGRFVVGEEVFGTVPAGRTAAAGHVVVPATSLSNRPRTTSFAASAALPSAAVTAWNGLIELAGVHAGLDVLVQHAASPAGVYAIQLAALVGANVIAIGGRATAPILRDLGAHEVLAADAHTIPQADVVFDPTAAEHDLATRRTFAPPAPATREQHRWQLATATRPFAHGFATRSPEPQLALIADLVDAGGLRPVVDRVFPLADATAAHHHAATSSTPGSPCSSSADQRGRTRHHHHARRAPPTRPDPGGHPHVVLPVQLGHPPHRLRAG